MIRVSPTEPNPTHHISLTDGTDTVGMIIVNVNGDASPLAITANPSPRTAMKTSTGSMKYSDLEPPWTAIAQEDWSGGRGQEYEDDVTRFFDSHHANTMFKNIMLAPLPTYASGYRSGASNHILPGSVRFVSLLGDMSYLAIPFTPTNDYSAKYIYLHVRRRGNPTATLYVKLRASAVDGDGAATVPDTVLKTLSLTTANITDTESVYYRFTISAAQALVAGTHYWIQVSSSGDDENYWEVAVRDGAGTTKQAPDGSTWTDSTVNLYYRITAEDVLPARDKFFQYKQQQFLVRSAETGAPSLWINGDIGVADSNAAEKSKVIDATKSWTTDNWAGCVVVLIAGTGSSETTNWRTIVSNTGTKLTCDKDWVITHDTTTEYVIVNTDIWTQITGHGLTAPVTDVLVVNNNVYFAQGDGVNIRRANWYDNSGAATWRYADEGTAKAFKLCMVRDGTDGLVVWKLNNNDAADIKSMNVAPAVSTWADMTWGTKIDLLDDNGKMNSVVEYGTSKAPWVFREGSVFSIASDLPNEIPLKEMRSVMSPRNGEASLVHNIYLYFNLGSGLERYYDGDLSDMGMNRDAGMPTYRQGIVSKLIGYPGRFFAVIDGGDYHYSSLLCYNMMGWHEIYRCSVLGMRINDGQFQATYGSDPDKLWLSVGQDIIWLAFPSLTVEPSKDTNMLFVHEGSVITSWIYDNLFDVPKLWNSLKLFADNLTDDIKVEADFQVDDDTTWTPLSTAFVTVPSQEVDLSEDSIQGKRIRFRFRLMTNDKNVTPIVKTTVVEAISRVPVKYSYAFSYRCTDDRKDLMSSQEEYTADEQYAIIDNWARTVTKLKMNSIYKRYDDIDVFIDPPPSNPIEEKTEGYLDRMTLTEL